MGYSSIKFAYTLKNKTATIAEGYTINVFIDKKLKTVPIPGNIRKKLR